MLTIILLGQCAPSLCVCRHNNHLLILINNKFRRLMMNCPTDVVMRTAFWKVWLVLLRWDWLSHGVVVIDSCPWSICQLMIWVGYLREMRFHRGFTRTLCVCKLEIWVVYIGQSSIWRITFEFFRFLVFTMTYIEMKGCWMWAAYLILRGWKTGHALWKNFQVGVHPAI